MSTAASTATHDEASVHRGWLIGGLVLLILAGGALVYTLAPAGHGASVTVTRAYVREPASADVASAYLVVSNHTSRTLTLLSITTPSARSAHVMTESDGAMSDSSLVVPAHGKAVLKPNAAHVMLESPRGLQPSSTVRLRLTFDHDVVVDVDAPVIGVLAPAP